MPDPVYIWVLLLLLVLLLAWLVGRRLRPTGGDDWRARYVRTKRLCVGYAIFVALMTFDAFQRNDQSLFKRFFSPGCLILLFGIFLFQFLHARRKMRERPGLVEPEKRPTPAFFWQAVLILLPVTLMAGFGFWAILRERSAVEHEAQQRAREIFQVLPSEFGRIAANRLTMFQVPKNGWYGYLQGGIAAWPENKSRKVWLENTNEAQSISNALVTLHAAIPDWQEGPVPLVDFSLNTNGQLWFEQPTPPRPPAWLTDMTTEQRQAWTAIQSAPLVSESLSNLVESFRQTRPPPAALAGAEFLQLRAELPLLATTNAINKVLRFGSRHWNDVSETGVPLKTLALAEALKLSRDVGPTEKLWEALQSEVSSPSALTPILLDEASRLVATNAELSEAITAMRILLADKMAQANLAEAISQSDKLNGITTTNLWLDAMGERWFCILSPSELQGHTSVSNRLMVIDSAITQVQCYPGFLVARGFAEALADAKVSLPKYFSLTLELEGERVPLPLPWSSLGDGKPSGDILAEEQFQMSQTAEMTFRDTETGKARKVAFLAKPGSRQEGENIFFEAMPGHPQFSLQIRLTDRSLLYARQRQLQWIFGALIAASAVAALIGFISAYRAFRREQTLNEMKSNFVSSVSHELRAPIASVRLMAENLERGKISGAEKQGEYFRFIVQECRRLSSLVENVLDYSRIEQGRKQYEPEPTDLIALTQNTVKLMEPYAAEKGVKLETFNTQHSTPNIELNVDGRAIQQALVNLIDNAIKHSAMGQTVTVGLEAGSQRSEIRGQKTAVSLNSQLSTFNLFVSDSGPGIPAVEREKIFERFYRLGSELRRETQGVGIGLSVVKHIAEAHGGRVIVESEVGQGSRFTIQLPVTQQEQTEGTEQTI